MVTMVTMVTMVILVTVVAIITMVTMGGDLQPGCFADRLLTGPGQPQINHKLRKKERKSSVQQKQSSGLAARYMYKS